jgi:hypothetical protein
MMVVASQNQSFAKALAEQLVRELSLPCECVRSISDAAELNPWLTVTDEPAAQATAPHIITAALPLKLAELLQRIRHKQQSMSASYTLYGDTVFDVRLKQLSSPGRPPIDLTDKEARLLEALIKAQKHGAGRDVLLEQIWGIDVELSTHTVETHIYRLRAKLKECCGSEMIEATDGGYRMMR